MSILVEDCPRCSARRITFDVLSAAFRQTEQGWQNWYEIFCVCRQCLRSTVFVVGLIEIDARQMFYKDNGLASFQGALNNYFSVRGFVAVKDHIANNPPEHLPENISKIFIEGATCLAVQCHNAAATMFRLCIDMATRPLLPDPSDIALQQPNNKIRRDLGLRIAWLFDQQILPSSLKELAKCIREDANDGAHVGTLGKEDAEDLIDFTNMLLERLFTEPQRLRLAEERRNIRRS